MIGILFRWIFRSFVLSALLRIVPRIFPILAKLLRIFRR